MAGRVLQLLGTHEPAARHVALLTDELEVAGWHVEVAGPRGTMAVHGHLDHIVDIATAGERLAHRHLRTLTGAVDLVHAHGHERGEDRDRRRLAPAGRGHVVRRRAHRPHAPRPAASRDISRR